jgi:MFS family permease
MPRAERLEQTVPSRERNNWHGPSPTIILILLALLAVTLANAIMWPFYFVFGIQAGLAADAVNHAIAVSILFALGGSALASLVGCRYGRLAPAALGLIVVGGSLFLLCHTTDPFLYRLSVDLDMLGSYFLFPYLFGYAATEDPSGRGAATIGAGIPVSFTIGPVLGGMLVQNFGNGVMGWAAALGNILAFALLALVDRALAGKARPPEASTPLERSGYVRPSE